MEVFLTEQPLTIDGNGAGTTISFKFSNVGNAPAINVVPSIWLIAHGPNTFIEFEALCQEQQRRPVMVPISFCSQENLSENRVARCTKLAAE